ncbi:MAG: type III polyketide synthase [Cyclobacteriaceae bacterium]|nr:type III polyketide synthase [Cyclobacteriaceae bacterium]
MTYITSIGVANPPHRLQQSAVADFMIRAMTLDVRRAADLKALFRASGIETRYSVLGDYGKTSDFEFYGDIDTVGAFPDTRRRIQLYQQHAPGLAEKAIHQCLVSSVVQPKDITHLIVVSCTGMYAPGLDLDLVRSLGLRGDVQRTCVGFMGCYAAFNGLKLADAICRADQESRVLVVCTELCSIHFQREPTDENLLSNALFGDGAAALLLQSRPTGKVNLELKNFHCAVAEDGRAEMSWTVSNFGFEMQLTPAVPDVIRRNIRSFTGALIPDLQSIRHFAIHPGGRRILDVISDELALDKPELWASRQVLRNFGNMSSPTVVFVLQALLEGNVLGEGDSILSMAFGPGLTLESLLLEVHHA